MGNLNIEVAEAYEDFWFDESRLLIAFGGAGSAKSYTTAQKILTRIMSEEGHRWLNVRKVARTLRVSVFQLFLDLINTLGIINSFKVNKSDMTITYIPNGSMLMFFGLDDIEKLKSIQGITGIWIEEASETDKKDILELNRRLRGETKYYKQIILTFNPISHLHWLKEHFFDNPNTKVSIFKTTYKDNEFIDEEYKQEIEDIKNYDIQQYNIYALGEWGVLNNNIVYHNFDFTKHISSLTTDDFQVLHVGIDFNIGGCVCVLSGIRQGKVHIVDGFAVYDTAEIVTRLLSYKNKTFILYPDAAGRNRSTNASRSDIQILRDAGFTLDYPKANGLIRDRVNAVNRLFATDMMYINDRVEKLMHSLQTQAYKDNGEPEKFTDHKGGAVDDWNDGLGYFAVRKFPLTKQGVKRTELNFG